MYTLEGVRRVVGGWKDVIWSRRLCVCVSVFMKVRTDFSPLTLEECLLSGWQQMLMFVLACSVGVWCM